MRYYRKKHRGVSILAKKKSDIFYIEYTMRIMDFILSVDAKKYAYIKLPKYLLILPKDEKYLLKTNPKNFLLELYAGDFDFFSFGALAERLVFESRPFYLYKNYPKKYKNILIRRTDMYNAEISFLKRTEKFPFSRESITKARDKFVKNYKKGAIYNFEPDETKPPTITQKTKFVDIKL